MKSQLKPIENSANRTNKNAFKKLRFLSGLSLEAKELDEIKKIDKKLIIPSLSVCIQMERSLTLTFLEE